VGLAKRFVSLIGYPTQRLNCQRLTDSDYMFQYIKTSLTAVIGLALLLQDDPTRWQSEVQSKVPSRDFRKSKIKNSLIRHSYAGTVQLSEKKGGGTILEKRLVLRRTKRKTEHINW